MSFLNHNQIEDYNNKGYVSPINIFSKQEAKEIREEIEKIEKKWPEALTGLNRNYVHLISPVFDKICHNSKILDAVESLIGKNILIYGTTLFIKNTNEKAFVSFHKNDLQNHNEKFNENNLLTRGQTVENVPLEKTDPIILNSGQMSLHHPKIVHGSGLNKSNDRRIGFVIQSYIGSDVDQVLGKMYVQKARGEDTYCYHQYANRPLDLMSEKDINFRNKANDELSKIFYKDAAKRGRF